VPALASADDIKSKQAMIALRADGLVLSGIGSEKLEVNAEIAVLADVDSLQHDITAACRHLASAPRRACERDYRLVVGLGHTAHTPLPSDGATTMMTAANWGDYDDAEERAAACADFYVQLERGEHAVDNRADVLQSFRATMREGKPELYVLGELVALDTGEQQAFLGRVRSPPPQRRQPRVPRAPCAASASSPLPAAYSTGAPSHRSTVARGTWQ
jgi:hypothetical protein